MTASMAIDADVQGADDIPERDQLDLSDTQVQALEKLDALGEAPRQTVNEKWHPNPQVRAYQMMYEGKIGGPGRGQGRKAKKRASAQIVEHIRDPKTIKKITKALDNALDDDEHPRVQLEAVKIAADLDDKHARFELDEEKQEAEIDAMERDDLIAEIITLAEDPATQAAIEGFGSNGSYVNSTADEVEEDQPVLSESWEGDSDADEDEETEADIPEAEVVTPDDSEAEDAERVEASEVDAGSGGNGSRPKVRRRGPATRARKENANAVLKAAKRRAAQRRRTS
jgi:hypothetical protein